MVLNYPRTAIPRPHSTMTHKIRWTPVTYIKKVDLCLEVVGTNHGLRLVLTLLRTNENSWPFLEPVTEDLAPNYLTIIEVSRRTGTRAPFYSIIPRRTQWILRPSNRKSPIKSTSTIQQSSSTMSNSSSPTVNSTMASEAVRQSPDGCLS